jgi:hypothetical protein
MAHIGEKSVSYRNVWQRYHLEDLGVDGRILLKLIFCKQDGFRRLDWSGFGTSDGIL